MIRTAEEARARANDHRLEKDEQRFNDLFHGFNFAAEIEKAIDQGKFGVVVGVVMLVSPHNNYEPNLVQPYNQDTVFNHKIYTVNEIHFLKAYFQQRGYEIRITNQFVKGSEHHSRKSGKHLIEGNITISWGEDSA